MKGKWLTSVLTSVIVAVAVLAASSPVASVASLGGVSAPLTDTPNTPVATEPADGPGWPMPDKPIPYHRPGHLSTASQYRTQVEILSDDGLPETVMLSGVDAMVADGLDPLAGNHTLVSWDQLLRSSGDRRELETFSIVTEADDKGIYPEPGSKLYV